MSFHDTLVCNKYLHYNKYSELLGYAVNSTHHLIFPDAFHYLKNTLKSMKFGDSENNTPMYGAFSCLLICEWKDPGRTSHMVSDFFLFFSLLAVLSQAGYSK